MNNLWDSTLYQQTIWLKHSLQIITDMSYVQTLKRGTYIYVDQKYLWNG